MTRPDAPESPARCTLGVPKDGSSASDDEDGKAFAVRTARPEALTSVMAQHSHLPLAAHSPQVLGSCQC